MQTFHQLVKIAGYLVFTKLLENFDAKTNPSSKVKQSDRHRSKETTERKVTLCKDSQGQIFNQKYVNLLCKLTLTRLIGLPPHAPVAQKVAEQCTLIST